METRPRGRGNPKGVAAMAELTAEILRRLVTYDPATGVFRWRARRPHCRPGDLAGGFDKDGYWRVGIFGKRWLAHHLAWLYVHGELPTSEPDHINMERADNRIANLRLGSRRDNIANSGLRITNSSGFKGVYWCTQRNKWKVRIRDGDKQKFLGFFDDIEQAGAAYAVAARQMYGDFARLV
jgi:HNH endonuclease